jgi:transposase
MSAQTLLPDPRVIRIEYLVPTADTITLVATTVQPEVCCPDCGRRATRVHSGHRRTPADLPWHGFKVRLELHLRRFFCDQPDCPRVTFVERLSTILPPYARRTARLAQALVMIGYAIGGEGGARVAAGLGMDASPDTLLRQLKQLPGPARATPRVLGVDDWAFRKGHHYGTILVDLERRTPVDLLPDRRAETLATWLTEHPGVEVISRDRGGAYAEGARQGAPEATQVADRWHLLKNLAEALEAVLLREHRAMREAAQAAAAPGESGPAPLPAASSATPASPAGSPAASVPGRETWTRRAAREKAARRDRRYQRYTEVVERQQRGESHRQIAAATGLSRETIRRYLAAGCFPEIAPRVTAAPITPFLPYLKERWEAGCHNARVLWEEIAAQGFTGAASAVYRATALWREQLPPGQRRSLRQPRVAVAPGTPAPAPRAVVWWLIGQKQAPTAEQTAFIDRLLAHCPELHSARELVQAFFRLVRQRDGEGLDGWMGTVERSGIPELVQFAAGLRRDWEAVVAGLTLPWSNGPVEGAVNRLKLLKRQMYGRAGLPLLRARVLAA